MLESRLMTTYIMDMLISFTVSNWRSFKDETTLSCVAQDERRFLLRVPKIRRAPVMRVVPVVAIYGGNASGKSNFVKALAFLQNLIMAPASNEKTALPVEPFLLNGKVRDDVTVTLQFLAKDDNIYQYSVCVDAVAIRSESLSVMRKGRMEPLYLRDGKHIHLKVKSLSQDKTANAFLQVLPENQLMLAMAGQKTPALQNAYDWFANQLNIIGINSHLRSLQEFARHTPNVAEEMGTLLNQLGTGIHRLSWVDAALASLPMTPDGLPLVKPAEGQTIEITLNEQRFTISRKDGAYQAKKLVAMHRLPGKKDVAFDLLQESAGSRRLIELLPAFIDLARKDRRKVYVIDELGRSWHHELSRRLLTSYLGMCGEESRGQLLFTTHDLMLMDQMLFRQDELCLMERAGDKSAIRSVADFAIRTDKDIRKLYMTGALGGRPLITRFGSLADD